MTRRDKSRWPEWAGRLAAANAFIAMLAGRDLTALQAWRIAFWPSVGISALAGLAVGLLVTIICRKLERGRLLHHATAPEYQTDPEERDYISKVAADIRDVMQKPFVPRDRYRKRTERPLCTAIEARRDDKKNAAPTDGE